MKIAVCLSGYLRCYKELNPNLQRYLYTPLRRLGQVDTFISTWDELNSIYTFSSRQGDTLPNYGPFDEQDVIDTFKPKDINIDNFDDSKPLFHAHELDPEIDISALYPTIHDNGTLFGLSMFFKRFDCNLMKIAEEDFSGKYDIVIQMRPDIFFLKELDLSNFDPNKLYSRTLWNDNLLISSSANIDKISFVFSEAKRIALQYKTQRPEWFEPYCPEYFLEHLLAEQGFNKSNRVELGEDSMLVYPRKNFGATVHDILTRHGRVQDINTLFNPVPKYA